MSHTLSHYWFIFLLVFILLGCEKEQVEIDEEMVNLRPVIEAPFGLTACSDSLFELSIMISDPNNDQLEVWMENQAPWLNFDTSTYKLYGTPQRSDKGSFTFKISASDGDFVTNKEITLTVQIKKDIQETLDDELSSLFEFNTNGLTGVSAAIITPQDELLYSTAGERSPFSGGPIHPNHRYRMASVSKVFTAALCLRLQEEGILSLSDKLFDYLPVPGLPDGDQITLLHLLSHTSGLADHLNDNEFWQSTSGNDTWSTDDIIDYAVGEGLSFSPGSGYAYSNTGFYLMGAVIEEATNMSLSEAFENWVFDPLSLDHTLYDDFSTATNPIDSLAINERSYEYHQSAVGAAGAIVSTPGDIARFGHALYDGEWLQPASLEAMLNDYGFAVGGDHYGLGTRLWDDNGYVHHGHTGALMDYRSIVMYVPSKKVTIAIATNDTHSNWFDLVNGLLVTIAGYY